MRFYLAAPLLLAAIAPAAAQDVPAYSRDAAEALLGDAAADDVQTAEATCAKGTVRLPDGSCSATRRFSLPNRSGQQSTASGLTLPGARSTPPGAMRTAAKAPARPQARRGVEVPLQFRTGSSELSPQSMTNLRTLATVLNASAHSGKRIQILGHTDRTGGAEANRKLSQQRADAAAAYLVSQGVNSERIEAIGKGYDAPLAGVSTYSPRQRRVEVIRVK